MEPARIREIRLVFDCTPAGVIVLNELGFNAAPSAEESARRLSVVTPSGS